MAVSCASARKAFITSFPHISIAVASLIILGQLVIIALALACPACLGLFERVYSHGTVNATSIYLTDPQSISLGVATIIIVLEGIAFGILTGYQEFKKYVINASELKPTHGPEPETSPSSKQPLIQRDDPCKSPHFVGPFKLRMYYQLSPKVKTFVRKLLVLYIAEIAFELVEFLTKWLLLLLVVRGNWLSVGVAIVGGVSYPFLQLWKGVLHSQRLVPIKPAGYENID